MKDKNSTARIDSPSLFPPLKSEVTEGYFKSSGWREETIRELAFKIYILEVKLVFSSQQGGVRCAVRYVSFYTIKLRPKMYEQRKMYYS